MRPRQPLPRIWLMTDERLLDLDAAIAKLPRGSGIVFRHYSLAPDDRFVLFKHVRRKAKARRHVVVLADRPALARHWGANGAHDRSSHRSAGLRTCSVHSIRERVAAQRAAADLIFVSPVYATRSHPGAKALGLRRARQIAGPHWNRTILLGGMTERRFRKSGLPRAYGWAAIDAFRT